MINFMRFIPDLIGIKVSLFLILLFPSNIFGEEKNAKNFSNSSAVMSSALFEKYSLLKFLNHSDWIHNKKNYYNQISKTIALDEKIGDSEKEKIILKRFRTQWQRFSYDAMEKLNNDVFNGWNDSSINKDLSIREIHSTSEKNVKFSVFQYDEGSPLKFLIYVIHRNDIMIEDLDLLVLNILEDKGWSEFTSTYAKVFPKAFDAKIDINLHDPESFDSNRRMFENQDWGMAYFSPRGIGTLDSIDGSPINEKYYKKLKSGESLEEMQVFDVIRSVNAIRLVEGMKEVPLWIQSNDNMSANVLYASLYMNNIKRLDLHNLPESHAKGPEYVGMSNFIDLPHCLALALQKTRVILYQQNSDYPPFAKNVIDVMNFKEKSLSVRQALKFD